MSLVRRFVVTAALFALVPPLAAQSSNAVARGSGSDARERLGFIIGTWTIEGMEESFTEVCDWYHQRSHVVCNSEITSPGGVQNGVSVFSYSEAKGRYLYYHYGSSGVANEMDLFLGDKSLVATHERQIGTDLVREQVWMTPRGDGTYDFREDNSTNGGPWKTMTSLRYIPKPAPAT